MVLQFQRATEGGQHRHHPYQEWSLKKLTFPQRPNKTPRSQQDIDSYKCIRHRHFNCVSFSYSKNVFTKPYAISNSACFLTDGDNTNGSKSRNDLQHDSRETCLIPKELGIYLKRPLGHKLSLELTHPQT